MYKLLSLLTVSLLLFTACNRNWDYSDATMPEELRLKHEEILQEELTILKEDPENLNALFEVAFRYHQLGDYKKAVKYYERVLEQNETDGVTLNNLASLYEDMEDYEMAAEYIKKLYPTDPANIEVIKDTVRILLKAEDAFSAQEALDNFKKQVLSSQSPNPDMQELVDSLQADIDEINQL